MNKIEWNTGLNGYRKNSVVTEENKINYCAELTETDFEPNRPLDAILYDHTKDRGSRPIELLYSGGMDSQVVLNSLIKNHVPVEAITMVVKVRGAIVNVADLYYAEKFCRENNIKQNFFYLDALDFYESGRYLEYIEPYNIPDPHLASHFWLLEQCQSYPVIGGDWPWVQTHTVNQILSPYRLSHSCYELFLKDKKIDGIGDFIGYSFESVCYFVQKHIENKEFSDGKFFNTPFIKHKVYGTSEPRIKSYGWEECPLVLFDVKKYTPPSMKNIKYNHEIVWGEKLKALMGSPVYRNSQFI